MAGPIESFLPSPPVEAPTVLVVDDEENIRLVLETVLIQEGYSVRTAASGEEALEKVKEKEPSYVFADVRMGGMSGIEFCRAVRDAGFDPTIIVMSAYGSLDLAIEGMKAGAYDYIAKPFKQDEIRLVLRKAVERETLRKENKALRQVVKQNSRFDEMIGQSPAMQKVFRLIDKVAEYSTTVLIQGESGTGKELIAKAIHTRSPRAEKPFVAINCGAIPASLLESELFGHKKGAFTDAKSDRKGLFEQAHGGTLFLDEIGELPLPLQVKILRVLQESVVRPIGGNNDIKIDVRFVAATHRTLEDDVAEKKFREDLYYRLNVVQIRVPPLRERREDIPLFVGHFIEKNNLKLGTSIHHLDDEVSDLLMRYSYPGNVRELENLIERAVVLADTDRICLEDLPDRFRAQKNVVNTILSDGELSIKKSQRYLEEQLIRRALEKTGGNRTAASKLLEISHRALLYKLKDYGLTNNGS